MLARSAFFFTRNASIIKTASKAQCTRLCLAPPKSRFPASIFQNVMAKRRLTISAPRFAQQAVKPAAPAIKKSSYPLISNKAVGYWLVSTSGLIFGIVVVGGLTRLTESGLSITEWKPVTGTIPPLNHEEWELEFAKYKESPEFKQLNSHITLDEFKFIFCMEWGHRLLGRCIGMFFILPAIYFWKSGKMSARVSRRVVGLTGLLGLQGAIGWWMVKSGLDEENLAERKSKPTVSQYRLTTHLGAAFLMYLGVLWTAFEIFSENRMVADMKKNPKAVTELLAKLNSPALNKIRGIGLGLLTLAFVTAMSGGMVAGLDAGLIYNTFPHMGDDYIPSKNELWSPVYARKADKSDLWWRNLLENPTTVQLVHRIFATSAFFAIVGAHLFIKKNQAVVPRAAMKRIHGVSGLATLQVALGISTLIYLVPIPLAAAHQAGALALLTSCLAFCASVKRPRPQTVNYISSMMKEQLLKK